MQFLDLIESYDAADASAERLYAKEGRSVRGGRKDPHYKQSLLEAARLYEGVLAGTVRVSRFQEAMSTSDFQYLFADVIDRQMLNVYQHMPVMWQSLARRGRVRDFRTVNRFTLDGGEAILSEVKQATEYPAAALTDGKYSYQVKKYGRRLPLTWESFVNDDLDALGTLPTRLANAARFSEERFATSLFSTSAGPDSTFFSSGNRNKLTVANVVSAGGSGFTTTGLNVTALQAAFTLLAAQVDTDGNPIFVDGVYLVVPPALDVTASNILNATEILAATGGGDGTGNDQVRAANWMRNRVTKIVNPWLPIVDTTSGNSAWYLFADPNVGRPAMEIGFLVGHEAPELFLKAPNAIRIGGAAADPMDGDFDTDSVDTKVRHTFGGVQMDPKSAVAATGTSSP